MACAVLKHPSLSWKKHPKKFYFSGYSQFKSKLAVCVDLNFRLHFQKVETRTPYKLAVPLFHYFYSQWKFRHHMHEQKQTLVIYRIQPLTLLNTKNNEITKSDYQNQVYFCFNSPVIQANLPGECNCLTLQRIGVRFPAIKKGTQSVDSMWYDYQAHSLAIQCDLQPLYRQIWGGIDVKSGSD